ncbi:hypothetical protein SADUNF_Sadunf04G0130900 [Salix dunnii]|uniref:Uncharacterized protein n=1 Tax=Salix dunnii TaxID=1413687 RepID=A0A835MZG7_9ROSI|nr:hypothetical protein SADUNF_Sadunf04G0130900 [Salix dunnii]
MVCDFTAKQLFSYDSEKSSDKISEKFTEVIDAFMYLPLNIPGTTYHKCFKDKGSTPSILRNTLKERMNSPAEPRRGDFLDQIIADMDKEKFLTEDFIVINETLRLGNVAPGLLRRALQDIQVKGYIIPAGCVIMAGFDSYAVSKNLMPFSGGRRQRAGSEFTKLFMAIFLHKMVTNYLAEILHWDSEMEST